VRRWGILAALSLGATAALGAPAPAGAQPCAEPPVPVEAKLFFTTPPPDGTFGPGDRIPMALTLRNASCGPVTTDAQFTREEHWRLLYFARIFGGGIVINTDNRDVDSASSLRFCSTRGGQLVRPLATPVQALEVLAGPSSQPFLEHKLDDARAHYALTPGRYRVEARIPFHAFTGGALIDDCNDFPGQTLLDLLAPVGRRVFTIVSNSLEFVLAKYSFGGGFLSPMVNDSTCAAPPCGRAFKAGSTIPVKFQLGAASGTAVVEIRVFRVAANTGVETPVDLGSVGGDTGTHFKFDPKSGQFHFNLSTRGFAPGVYRIEARPDDGSVHAVHIALR